MKLSDYLAIGPDAPSPSDLLPSLQDAAVGATAIPTGIGALLLPPKGATGLQQFVPGIVPQAYNMLSGLKQLSGEFMQPFTGVEATGLPGHETTEAMAKGSQDAANDLIPHVPVDASSPSSQVASDMGNAFGSAAPFGVTKGLVEGLPMAARALVGASLPGVESASAAPIMAGMSGASDILTQADPVNAATSSPVLQGQQTQQQDSADPYAPLPTPPIPPLVPPPAPPAQGADPYAPLDPANPYKPLAPAPTSIDWAPDTLGKVAMYGAAALAVIAGGPKAVKFADELVGGLRDSWYGDSALKYNNSVIAKNFGAMDVPHVEAPLPVGVGGPGNTLNTALFNDNARLQAYTDAIAQNPTQASRMRADTGLVNNNASFNARVADIATTGIDRASNTIMPPIVEHFQRVANLEPAQQTLYNQARWAANELDNRTTLYNQARANIGTNPSPGALDDANFRVNFPNTDSQILRNLVAAGQADPAVKAELDVINHIHQKLMYAGVSRDFISPGEAANLIREHPNYMQSVNTDGTVTGGWGARGTNVASGIDNIPVLASEVDKQHFVQMFRDIENNAWKRNIIDASMQYQDANPSVAQIFRRNFTNMGEDVKPEAQGDTISLRRNGQTENYKVGNTALLRDLQGGATQQSVVMQALNYSRSIFQSAVTGPLAAASGHFFPAINVMRNTLLGSVFRPAGTSYGPISSGISSLTDGRLNPRGLLPDAALGTVSGMLQGIGAEGSHAIASMLDGTNGSNLALRVSNATLGPQWTSAIQQRMQAAWDTSIRAEMKSLGLLGNNGYSYSELPAKQIGAREMVASPINNLVPQLFRTNGMLGPFMPVGVKLASLYHDMASIVNDAAQTHFFSTNKGRIPTNELAYETKQLTGDPGTHGGNPVMRAVTGAVPYSNIIGQDIMRMVRSFKETPLSTAYGVISALGTLALANAYTAMLSGPAATKHMTQELSNDQQAAKVYFYVPGISPESSPYFDLPQRVRWMYPVFRQAAYDGLNMQAHEASPQTAADALDWLHTYFNKHITTNTAESSLAGLSATVSPQPPPMMQAAFNMVGANVQPTLYNQMMPGETGNMPIGGDINAPGHLKGSDPLTGSVAGERISHAVSSLLGVGGASILTAINSVKAGHKAGNDSSDIRAVLEGQWMDRLKDSVPILRGTVFANNSSLSTKSPLIEHTEAALDALRPTATWKSDAKYGPTDSSNGYTRAKGPALDTPPLTPAKTPSDPTMARMYDTYGAYTSYIEKKMMPLISDTRKQMNSLIGSPKPIDEIRAQHNVYQRKLETQYEKVAGVIQDADTAASRIAGRPVTISHIDWSKGMDQFH